MGFDISIYKWNFSENVNCSKNAFQNCHVNKTIENGGFEISSFRYF